MVQAIDPKIGETVYDPGCGTGGFLAQAFEHISGQARRIRHTPSRWRRSSTGLSTAARKRT